MGGSLGFVFRVCVLGTHPCPPPSLFPLSHHQSQPATTTTHPPTTHHGFMALAMSLAMALARAMALAMALAMTIATACALAWAWALALAMAMAWAMAFATALGCIGLGHGLSLGLGLGLGHGWAMAFAMGHPPNRCLAIDCGSAKKILRLGHAMATAVAMLSTTVLLMPRPGLSPWPRHWMALAMAVALAITWLWHWPRPWPGPGPGPGPGPWPCPIYRTHNTPSLTHHHPWFVLFFMPARGRRKWRRGWCEPPHGSTAVAQHSFGREPWRGLP